MTVKSKKRICVGTILGLGILAGLTLVPDTRAQSPSANVHFFSGGLNNPRGLKFGPDGHLYVAEGGAGGELSTVGQCPQVPDVGPYTGGFTGQISKIDKFGNRSTVADKLPSSQTNAQQGSLVSSVADVAFIGNTLYAVLAGAGCSHGLKGTKKWRDKSEPGWNLDDDRRLIRLSDEP